MEIRINILTLMNKKIRSHDYSINSIIGEHTSFEGTFNIKGHLRIDGNFRGKVNSSGRVIIGKNGRSESTIIAKTVVVGGTVKGDIFADGKVIVLKTGEIIGNIYACSVNMEDGVIFNGECKIFPKDELKRIIETKKKEKYSFK